MKMLRNARSANRHNPDEGSARINADLVLTGGITMLFENQAYDDPRIAIQSSAWVDENGNLHLAPWVHGSRGYLTMDESLGILQTVDPQGFGAIDPVPFMSISDMGLWIPPQPQSQP